ARQQPIVQRRMHINWDERGRVRLGAHSHGPQREGVVAEGPIELRIGHKELELTTRNPAEYITSRRPPKVTAASGPNGGVAKNQPTRDAEGDVFLNTRSTPVSGNGCFAH